MKSFLGSVFSFVFISSLAFFLWDILPNWGEMMAFGLVLITAFWMIHSFLSSVLSFIFSHFSRLFTFLVALALCIGMGVWGYNKLFTATGQEQAPATTNLLENNDSKEITLSFDNTQEASKENLLATLENNSSMGSQEKEYWKKTISTLTPDQIEELAQVLSTKSPTQSIAPFLSPLSEISQSPSPAATPQIMVQQSTETPLANISPSPTLSYGSDSSKNWKKPVIKPLETAFPNTEKTAPKLVSSGISDEKFILPLENINAQMVFPKEYPISSIVYSLDQVQFAVKTPEELRAFVEVKISEKGELFSLLAPKFTNVQKDTNIFFITHTTEKTRTYSSFFNGLLWEIEIRLPFAENPLDDDFYSVLLPIIFEEKEE